jgi:ABC-type arginine/histidine transport system permease subunit
MVSVTQVVVGFGLSVIASIISAFVTVKLSLKQFRSERLWEKKAETYSNIIEHLSRLEYQLWLWREGMTSHPLSCPAESGTHRA